MATTNFREKEREAAAKKARERKRKRRKKQALAALIVILVISLITVCVLSFTVFFKISDINISGSSTYSAEEITSVADIGIGDNLLLLDKTKIEEALVKELPFIDQVDIKRVLPDMVEIAVEETKEELCITDGKSFYSANLKGKIIKEYSAAPENLIVITVSKNVTFKIGECITFSNKREDELFSDYVSVIEKQNFDIDFINVSDPYDSYMQIEERIIVEIGSSSYFEDKIAYLKASLGGVSKNAEGVFALSAWTPENNQPVLTYGDISDYEK